MNKLSIIVLSFTMTACIAGETYTGAGPPDYDGLDAGIEAGVESGGGAEDTLPNTESGGGAMHAPAPPCVPEHPCDCADAFDLCPTGPEGPFAVPWKCCPSRLNSLVCRPDYWPATPDVCENEPR